MIWTKIVELFYKLIELVKKNIGSIGLLLLHFEVVRRKIRETLDEVQRQEDKHREELKKIRDGQNAKTKDAQNKIDALKKPIHKLVIIFCLLLAGCATTRVIYKTEYIKPDLPTLYLCGDKPLETLPTNEFESIYYADCALYLEQEILIYTDWKADFEASIEPAK